MGRLLARWSPGLVMVGALVACSTPPDEPGIEVVALAPTPAVRKVAVVLLKLSDDPLEPFTPADERTLAFTGQYSARAMFLEWSFGLLSIEGLNGPTGDVFGWYPIAATGAQCNLAAFMAEGKAAATAGGVDLDAYDSVVYTWNASSCGGGSAAMPGNFIFLSPGNATGYAGALAHELGHNMGLQHSGSLQCRDGTGTAVAFSADCTPIEYGDSFDVMGPDAPRMSAFHKEQLGWLADANKQIVTTDGDYVIAPLEQASTGVQALRIPRPNDPLHDLFLDFRQPFGLDNFFPNDPAVNGVMIRLVPTTITAHQPALLDMTPATPTDVSDATLLLNQTFDDAAAGIHITTTAVAPTGVTVHVVIDPIMTPDGPPDAGVDAPPIVDAAVDAAPDAASDAAIDAPLPDAASGPDAAMLPDAEMRDSGTGPDAPDADPSDDDGDGGCGCSTDRPPFDAAWLLLGALLVATRRRRSARRSR